MLSTDARRWTAACWLGYTALFLGFMLTGQLLELFWPEAWPDHLELMGVDPAAPPDRIDAEQFARFYRFGVVYHFFHLAAFGALIGWLQATVLRGNAAGMDASGREPPVGRGVWSLLAAVGFSGILILDVFRPGIVSGGHPAPIEPILIAVGGGTLAGLLQWLYLRRRGVDATRWLGHWFGGLVAGLIAAVAILWVVGLVLEPAARGLFDDRTVQIVGQIIFFTVYGSVVGAVAGWISGRAMSPLTGRPVAPAPAAAGDGD